jgi:DNA-binding LytR/AlgR family response regulator
MISCAIVEDESVSAKMVEMLAEKTGLLLVKKSFSSAQESMPWLAKNDVDLLFLDVEMPGISGIDLLKVLARRPEVIIISSNPDYAIDAFEFSVADYLLKPVKDYNRFLQAVNKVAARLNKSGIETNSSIFVKLDSLLHKLDIDDIQWIEAFGDYIKIQTCDQLHVVYSTIKKIEEKLDSKKFVRIHRSFIINTLKISNLSANNLEINKRIIPIGETYKDALLQRLSIL